MGYRIFFVVLFTLSFLASISQSLIVEGTVRDRESKERLSRVNILLSETTSGTTTKSDGTFRFKIRKADDYTLYFNYLGYAQEKRSIQREDFPTVGTDTLYFDVELIYKSTELPSVTVSAESKPDTVHGTQEYNIADFGFLPNNDLALLTYTKNLKKDAQIARLSDLSSSRTNLPPNPQEIYTDYKSRLYLLYENEVLALFDNGKKFDTLLLSMADFTERINPIIDSVGQKLIYSDYKWFYPKFNYFLFDRTTEKSASFTTVTNDELLELYRSEYKYLPPRKRLEAAQMEYETGIDREDYAALLSDFPNSMYYEPLYAPALTVFDTIMVFDHYGNTLTKYNQRGDQLEKLPIYYHTQTEDGSKWKKRLIQDVDTREVYGMFMAKGSYYLRKIDLASGQLKGNFKLTHRYVENIQIRDGWVYYLYRPFGSIQNVYLYKEEIL